MATILTLPKFSDEQDPAVVLNWLKNEGDKVLKGEVILEIETEKSVMELEAESDGILLYIKIPKGKVKVNDILGVIGEQHENAVELLKQEEAEKTISIDKAKGVDVIRLPQLSDAMEEAVILDWKFEVGDVLKKGDIIAEVETDKAVIEIDSFREGTILYRLPKTQYKIKVGTIIMIVGDKGAPFKDLLI